MEDILAVYCRPYDARFAVVCMDETSRQLIGEVCEPMSLKPGRARRVGHGQSEHPRSCLIVRDLFAA